MPEKSYIIKWDISKEEIREIEEWSEASEIVEPLAILKKRGYL